MFVPCPFYFAGIEVQANRSKGPGQVNNHGLNVADAGCKEVDVIKESK